MRAETHRGQALVEFSLALIPFLLILMGIVDLGRGIYMSNGVSQAAREIARVTAVHTCSVSPCTVAQNLGSSSEAVATIGTQAGLIPGMAGASAVTFACTTVNDTVVPGPGCNSSDLEPHYIRVTVTANYAALTPILSMVAPKTLTSTAHIQVP